MGDLAVDTAVEPTGAPGRYRIRLSRDWEIWGPNGGYFASVALRAAGLESAFDRPATFSCLYLGVAGFDDDVELQVTSLRKAKRAEALRVEVTQGDRSLLEAHLWTIDGTMPGLEHDAAVMPEVPGPDELQSIASLSPAQVQPKFWRNFDRRFPRFIPPEEWPPPPPHEPITRQWLRFEPTPTFEDPWVDAARYVVLLDTFQWPAAHGAHIGRSADEPPFIAPNLDLSVRFHRAVPESEWLLVDGFGPVAEGGLMTGETRLWTEDRRLVASAAGHLLCREVPKGTPGSGT